MKKANGTDQIKIEKGVPIPPIRNTTHLDKAIQQMEVGDSIRIPKGQYGSVRTYASINKKSIRTRADGEGFIRVWRIA